MFCTTECWSCEDKSCEHYFSKEKLYFENQQLKDRINKAIEYIENDLKSFLYSVEYKKFLEILKGIKTKRP